MNKSKELNRCDLDKGVRIPRKNYGRISGFSAKYYHSEEDPNKKL